MEAPEDDPDGSGLLTSRRVGELLAAAVDHAGGHLVTWSMDHVDAHPGHSTTATYVATVRWPHGEREELLGVSARNGGPGPSDQRADIFADGQREVAVWIHPRDPDLPGLARAAYPEQMAALANTHHLAPVPVTADQVTLTMVGYRPRRRAVVRMTLQPSSGSPVTYYVKVQRERTFGDVLARHRLLLEAGSPAPEVAVATEDHLLVLRELPGRPLARAMFDPRPPSSAEELIGVLDSLPAAVSRLPRRAPWAAALDHYVAMVARALPDQEPRLAWIADQVHQGLDPLPAGDEPTHGDFHEGQVFVQDGRVSGILDIDTIGPGRRADDLACLVAHLSTVQRMNAEQTARVHHLLRTWVPVLDERVDPVELRLRSAAVAVSLATGPYRGQEPAWPRETRTILDVAEALVRQVR